MEVNTKYNNKVMINITTFILLAKGVKIILNL